MTRREQTGGNLASAKAKAHRLASKIDGVRERFKGGKYNHRSAVDRTKSTTGRERIEVKRLHNCI